MVGPLLRTMIDVGLHGILHKRTNCRIHVRVDALVADMDAMIQLCGKQVGTAAHCPWCNNALCPKGKEGHNGSWGDLHEGCGHKTCARRYGEHMHLWTTTVLPRRKSGVAERHWKGANGRPYREDTHGLGSERPVLYRYQKKVVSVSPSTWSIENSTQAKNPGLSAYIPPTCEAESQADKQAGWDTLKATQQEHSFVEWLLDHLRLIPDELHIAQRLIEGVRDLGVRLAMWNKSKQQGSLLFRTEWAEAAQRLTFIRNWRTYHLRMALNVSFQRGSAMERMLPATLVVFSRALAQLLHYLRHSPENGPPTTAEVPEGQYANVYSHVSAITLAFQVWLIDTVMCQDLGTKHMHSWHRRMQLSMLPQVATRVVHAHMHICTYTIDACSTACSRK
jgi:hypothetical protein